MVALRVAVIDEGFDLLLPVARKIVVLQRYPVLHLLMSALGLVLAGGEVNLDHDLCPCLPTSWPDRQ